LFAAGGDPEFSEWLLRDSCSREHSPQSRAGEWTVNVIFAKWIFLDAMRRIVTKTFPDLNDKSRQEP
jgi:hypothetical protein